MPNPEAEIDLLVSAFEDVRYFVREAADPEYRWAVKGVVRKLSGYSDYYENVEVGMYYIPRKANTVEPRVLAVHAREEVNYGDFVAFLRDRLGFAADAEEAAAAW